MTKHKLNRNDPKFDRPFGIELAAEYAGKSVATMKYHLYESGVLTGTLVGKTVVFTRADMDSFLERVKAPGRPALSEEERQRRAAEGRARAAARLKEARLKAGKRRGRPRKTAE
jgi:hypothetical protein